MTVLVLKALLVGAIGVTIAHGLAMYLGLDGGTPDWRIVGALAFTTVAVYTAIRA